MQEDAKRALCGQSTREIAFSFCFPKWTDTDPDYHCQHAEQDIGKESDEPLMYFAPIYGQQRLYVRAVHEELAKCKHGLNVTALSCHWRSCCPPGSQNNPNE